MPKVEEEIRDLSQKLAQNPDSMVFVQLADAYRRAGDLEHSVETCLKGLARHPTYATARLILGRDYFDLGRWDEAVAEFHRVESVDPDNILVHRTLGQIALRQGRTSEAIARQQRALVLDPDDSAAQELLKEALLRAKQPDAGAKAAAPPPAPAAGPVSSAPAPNPDPSARPGEPPRAVSPDHLKALKVADLYVKKKAWDQAEEVLDEILEAEPGFPPALERKAALAGQRAGRSEQAAKRRAEDEARQRALEEESKRRMEEEARRKAAEEARLKAEAEAQRRREEEESKRRAAEEAQHKAAEEARRRAETDALRRAAEEAARAAAIQRPLAGGLSAKDVLASVEGTSEELVEDEAAPPPAPAAAKGAPARASGGLKALLEELAGSVDGALAAVLVGLDGLALGQAALKPGWDGAALGAESAALFKAALAAGRNARLGRTQEVVVSTDKAVLLLSAVGASWFVILALEPDGNLGRGRLELRRRASQLERTLA